jgi:hypothetical protein
MKSILLVASCQLKNKSKESGGRNHGASQGVGCGVQGKTSISISRPLRFTKQRARTKLKNFACFEFKDIDAWFLIPETFFRFFSLRALRALRETMSLAFSCLCALSAFA